MLEILLVLNLKGVSLDQQSELDKKQKKLKAHKSRILQLSKKERKVKYCRHLISSLKNRRPMVFSKYQHSDVACKNFIILQF